MLALTLTQPFAECVARRGKRMENRSWPPPDDVVGTHVAIHAGAAWPSPRTFMWMVEHAMPAEHRRWAYGLQRGDLPLGAVVAVARVASWTRTPRAVPEEQRPWAQVDWQRGFARAVGWCGWLLDDVVALRSPVPCRGRQRLWELPTAVALAVGRQCEPAVAPSGSWGGP